MVRIALVLACLAATAHAKPAARKPKPPSKAALALSDEAAACPETATADKGLPCLHDKVSPKGKAALWRHTRGGPLAAHQKTIDQLAKGAIVVEFDEGCDGTENQLLVVVKGKQVIGAFAQTTSCNE